ncbi:MAG: hypothetical protein ABEH43_11475, partial [Flavobacteriales bacterium]
MKKDHLIAQLVMAKPLKILPFVGFLLFTITLNSQNLVPNPSFEDTLSCPSGIDELPKAKGWYFGGVPSSDFYHKCYNNVPCNGYYGCQNALTGVAYPGIYTSYFSYTNTKDTTYREYISTKMKDSLKSGVTYYVSFYVNLSDSANYANRLGGYFSKDSIVGDKDTAYAPPFNAQIESKVIVDKNDWIEVHKSFVADGGERYFTIGNFRDDANTDTLYLGNGGNINVDDYNASY